METGWSNSHPIFTEKRRNTVKEDVTEEEMRTAILRELAPDLPQNRRRYLKEEGFLD